MELSLADEPVNGKNGDMSNEERAALMTHDEIVSLLVSHHDISRRFTEIQDQLDWLKRQLFGAKSERHIAVDDSRQLTLGEIVGLDSEAESGSVEVPAHRRRRNARDRNGDEGDLRFDSSVPVKQIILAPDIPAAELDDFEQIGEKKNRKLAQRPGSYVVLEYVRPVFKKNAAADAIDSEIICAPPVASVLERSLADVSLLTGLLIDKFLYHLPLFRQHQRMAACGVHLSRGTLTNWVHRSAELLEPIHEAQLASVLSSKVIAMDETPVKAGRKKKKPPDRGKMATGYFWPLYGDNDEVVFHFAPTRSHLVVFEVLEGFAGTLMTDGYEAYKSFASRFSDVCHAACWVHTRRGFDKALTSDRKLADQALDQIADLYKAEEELRERNLKPEKLLTHRALHCKPLVEAFFEWLRELQAERALLPTSPFTKALAYALEREQELKVFLENPGVPLDTNHLERQIRPIAVGRKNWLFCWTEVGAKYVGIVQSLLSTCRLQGVDPYTYLVDVLLRIQTYPASEVSELTPRLWKENFAAEPLGSDLDR